MSKLIFCDHCNKIIQYYSEGVEIEVNILGDTEYYPQDVAYGTHHLHRKCLNDICVALKTSHIMKEGNGSINPMEA